MTTNTQALKAAAEAANNSAIEAVARAICAECEENPDHKGDARGSEYRWQDYLGAAYAAVAASAKPVEQEPVAYLRFRAAQSWSGIGGHDVEHSEWLEACHAHEIGDDKLPAFPVYAAPQAPQAAPGCSLTEDQVSKMARYVSDFSSNQCGADKDDAWKIYGSDEIAVMRDALKAAGIEVQS